LFLLINSRTRSFSPTIGFWHGVEETHRYPFENSTNQGGQRCV
jgi:hypothetical protein